MAVRAFGLLELALIVLPPVSIVLPEGSWPAIGVVAGWDVLACIYLVIMWLVVRRDRRAGAASASAGGLPEWLPARVDRRLSFLFTVAASLTGISAAATIVLRGTSSGIGPPLQAEAVAAVIASWLLLHAGYMRYYAHLYREGGPGGLRFPGSAEASLVEFAYFALTLGTTFAVSDVEVTSRRMRYVVMCHSVLGFFYNAVVLAVAVAVLTAR